MGEESATPIVLVGASGHAKVVLEVLAAEGRYRVAGCVDPAMRGALLGVPILGGDEELPALRARGVTHAFVAIGDNRTRRRVTERMQQLGFALITTIHPRATISPSATIGPGTTVMAGVTVNAEARVGAGVILNTNASVDHDCVLADYVHCAPGTHLAGNVTLGEGTFLGVGAAVIPGIEIGAWTTVGAGAAVVRDLAGGIVAVGVPARSLPTTSA